MPLFQPSVLKKFLSQLDSVSVHQAYEKYCLYFHNSTIQDNIRNSKEEQFQEGFLRELFVSILGYTLNPTPNFNLTTEYKNVKDSKKADGAILVNDKVSAVIELKGTNTTDLGKIEAQAFGYKNNQPECVYVITSNFEKLRFYIDNAIEHIEFNLFTLTEKEFQLLYLCLGYANLSQNSAKKIKDESLSQEDVITKKLYKDYSLFKRELHHNLVQLNPEFEPLELFKKSQKLLDRFLFLFFGEDRRLLPPNSVRLILNQWDQLKELDEYSPLYERFKKYFGYLNTGYKGVKHDVFAYNGGLFKPDAILDAITIDDDLLYSHTLKLSEYDFASEVDVNILGHIFENSLNELDEITNEAMGLNPLAKGQTKRKKDGVFYTPKYITKYIVENTVGKLCEEQKAVLGIVEEDYFTDKKRQKKTLQTLVEKLEEYRKWLLQLTICDPACGSGAFLNQALDFLIAEHQYIDELQAKLFGDGLVLSDMENSILENNLFGVDLNEESVEIAKLSLWLRTAQPNRKLNDLNSNIKCGNSLIDDPAIAGDKAFNWQRSFPTIFKEKNKKAFHITTAIHDSRTSQRMIDYKVREKRDMGTNPYPNVCYLEPEDEAIITQTISEIVVQHQLNLLQYNICKDHVHLVLVCEEEEVPVLMQLIKGKTARVHNNSKGINPLVQKENEKAVPLWTQKFGCKEITTPEQLYNTIEYVKHNRTKHELAAHPKATALVIENMLCTQEAAFAPEYKGGFDVIIGNPPYVLCQPSNTNEITLDFYKNFEVASYKIDLFHLFFEKSIILLKQNGKLGFITPNTYLTNKYIQKLRNYILNNTKIETIVNYEDSVFFDANVDVATIILKKEKGLNDNIEIFNSRFGVLENLGSKKQSDWLTENENTFNIKQELKFDFKDCVKLEEISSITFGLQTKDKSTYVSEIKKEEDWQECYTGKDISRYFLNESKLFFKNKPDEVKAGGSWDMKIHKSIKIVVRQVGNPEPLFAFDSFGFPTLNTMYSIVLTNETYNYNYLISILNSNLIKKYWMSKFDDNKELFPKIKGYQLKQLPIKVLDKENQQPFIEKADQMLSLNKELQEAVSKFQRTIQRKFFSTMGLNPLDTKDMGKKLQDWYLLTYAEFIKELAKKKVKLSLSEEAEWEEYFNQESEKALDLKAQIDATDKAIDAMVYALYGLSEEEIEIVEKS
jgi:type I restriction-modification system DNA methylase subunit/REP element-mobilizing transposase RayT